MKKIIISVLGIIFLFPITLLAGDIKVLKNGINYTEISRPYTNTVAVNILTEGGLNSESEENSGLGSLTAIVWIKSNKILETSEFYGATVGAKLTPYAFEISFSSPTDVSEKLLKDFKTFLLNPKFSEEIFEREKALYIQELIASKDNPNHVASENYNKLSYKGTPYAKSLYGEVESIKKITLNDIKEYYKSNMQGLRMFVSVAGNYSDTFKNKLIEIVSEIPKGTSFKADCKNTEINEDRRKEDTDNKIKQSKLFIAYNAPEVSSKDYPAVKVLNELLGGRMSSRYFSEIRKKSGYAYSVYSAYPSRKCKSRFIVNIGLDYKNVNEAIKKIDNINLNLHKTITDDEIEKSKNSLLGSVLMKSQTNKSISWYRGFFMLMGLGPDYYEKYFEILENINKEDLIRVSNMFKGNKVVYVLKPQ